MAASVFRLGGLLRLQWVFIRRELGEQYAGTVLGIFWNLLQPLAMVAIYWWVFSHVWAVKVPALRPAGGDLPFVVFLLSGMLPWLAFQDAVSKGAGAILARADVIRHGAFPFEVFPIARVVAAHMVYGALFTGFALFLVVSGDLRSLAAAAGVIFLFVLQAMTAVGVALLLAGLAAYLKDIVHMIGMALMMIMFTAPIMYPLAQVPEGLRGWMWFNPFTAFAEGYHQLLLAGTWPQWHVWSVCSGLAVMILATGGAVFGRLKPGFADVV